MKKKQSEKSVPPCAASMGCLCAGHARGNPASAPCDSSEEPRRVEKTKREDSGKPWVSNYPALQAWLDKHEARCMWQCRADGRAMDDEEPARTYVECHVVAPGRLLIVTVHANRGGWEIYTPGASSRVDETLADADARLGRTRTCDTGGCTVEAADNCHLCVGHCAVTTHMHGR